MTLIESAHKPAAREFAAFRYAVLTAIALLGFVWLGRGLPDLPWLASDSASYLEFAPVRPHGYSLFLAAYRGFLPDLAHLPSVQLALYVGAVWMLAIAVTRRTARLIPGAVLLALALGLTNTTNFPYILSDSIYAALLIAGIACFLTFVETSRIVFLLLAGSGIGAAIAFRAIGLALLPGLVIAILAARRLRYRGRVRLLAFSLLPVVLVCSGAASSQLLHSGRFALGSWGGMDVLGKLPLLSHHAPEASPYARLDGIIDAMQPVRDKLAHLGTLLEALAARQYYEYLRWYVILPELKRSWPVWRDADEYERGRLAAALARAYALADPLGFLRLTAYDFAGLWTMPRRMTEGEYEAARAKIASLGDLPFLTAFAKSPEGEEQYYKIVPDPSDPLHIVLFRAVVASFWVVSLCAVGIAATRRGRTWLAEAPDLLLILIAVHAVYLATALMEGVHQRYIMPTWPLLAAAPTLALGLMAKTRTKR